jgi:hypothetical protein
VSEEVEDRGLPGWENPVLQALLGWVLADLEISLEPSFRVEQEGAMDSLCRV